MLLGVEVAGEPGEIVANCATGSPSHSSRAGGGDARACRLDTSPEWPGSRRSRRRARASSSRTRPDRTRQQRPETRFRFFFFASSAVASTLRTPGASTATGFSQKTCLPAATAAFRCIGRKCGGVAKITTSTSLRSVSRRRRIPRNGGPRRPPLVRASPSDRHEASVAGGRQRRRPWPRACSSCRPPARSPPAPLPRPPQPIRPIFKSRRRPAWAPRASDSPPVKSPAAAKVEVVFKKSRRWESTPY